MDGVRLLQNSHATKSGVVPSAISNKGIQEAMVVQPPIQAIVLDATPESIYSSDAELQRPCSTEALPLLKRIVIQTKTSVSGAKSERSNSFRCAKLPTVALASCYPVEHP